MMWAWRHPKPSGAIGRCIGRTDLAVDARKARRLARQIQTFARRHQLPRQIVTSPLTRCAAVGHWLARWGWAHHIDPQLLELDFGRWDGLGWAQIPQAELDVWMQNFVHHAPGGGESLQSLLERSRPWRAEHPTLVVAHAGWMMARRWNELHDAPPRSARDWLTPPAYAQCWSFST